MFQHGGVSNTTFIDLEHFGLRYSSHNIPLAIKLNICFFLNYHTAWVYFQVWFSLDSSYLTRHHRFRFHTIYSALFFVVILHLCRWSLAKIWIFLVDHWKPPIFTQVGVLLAVALMFLIIPFTILVFCLLSTTQPFFNKI